MDAHEHEPSYYEVALTNRQVVAGFVILLACLFAAFLSGVWLGRDGTLGAAAGSGYAAIATQPEAGESKLEQLTFFGEKKAVANAGREPEAAPPVRSAPVAEAEPEISPAAAVEAEKLRRTLEAEMAGHRSEVVEESAPEPAPDPAPATPAPGTRVRRVAETGASAAAESPAPAPERTTGAPTWIQVYSSPDGPRARELASRLRRNRFQAVVLEARSNAGTTFRVRVGPYDGREAAERAAKRLRREFRLDTWITDQP